MPKFMTYQRPAPVNRQGSGGKPGVPYAKPGKRSPKPAPKAKPIQLDLGLPPPPRQ